MNYEFAHPSNEVIISIFDKENHHKKIGDIHIKPSAVLWKSGHQGAFLKHKVSMDDFIAWMNTKQIVH